MITTLTIIRYSNGISIMYDGEETSTAIVSLDRTKMEDIGQIIWQDIENKMDREDINRVTMNIEISTD